MREPWPYGAENVKWPELIDTLSLGSRGSLGRWFVARPGNPLTTVLAITGVIATYVLLEWLSFIHEYKGVPITPWNPGLGLVFALHGTLRRALRRRAVRRRGHRRDRGAAQQSSRGQSSSASPPSSPAGYGLVAEADAQLSAARRRPQPAARRRAAAGQRRLWAPFSSQFCLPPAASGRGARSRRRPRRGWSTADWRRHRHCGDYAADPTARLRIPRPCSISISLPMLCRASSLRRGRDCGAVGHRRLPLDRMVPSCSICCSCPSWSPRCATGSTAPASASPSPSSAWSGCCTATATTPSAFTEFQLLMLVLSATGLTVGVVVTERQHADRDDARGRAQLKAKEAEAAQAARFNLVSGTAAALAHEINQPMTAARALARSVQHLLRGAQRRPRPRRYQPRQPDRADRSRRRRRAAHARLPAPRPTAYQHHRRAEPSWTMRWRSPARRRRRGASRSTLDVAADLPSDPWRRGAAAAGRAQSRAQCRRGDRRRAHVPNGRIAVVGAPSWRLRHGSKSRSRTTARASRPTSPSACSIR